MGSTKVTAPGPSEEEKELQRMQMESMRKATAEEKELEPFVLQSMGMIRDEAGELRKMTEDERIAGMSELERKQYDITGLELERQEMALKGEIPLTEATEQRYGEERTQFEETMSRKLGPAWQTSTPGIQAEKAFESRWGLLKEAERYGQMDRGTQAVTSQFSLLKGTQAGQYQQYATAPQRRLGLISGMGGMYQPYQYQRSMEYEAAQQTAINKAGLISDVMGMVGTAAGAYYGR